MFTRACPILPSSDFGKTKAFFGGLGFQLGSEYPDHGYLILYRDQVELHFYKSPEHVAETSDQGVFVRVEDARALSDEFAALGLPSEGIPRFEPAEDKPWGVCELAVIDGDGTLFRMGHVSK